jgi:hypothetical protein
VRYGGGVWSNIFIRKTTVHSRVGPCVHVTGQSTSLQVTNCSIGGVGAGYSYPISQITSNGTSFTVTAPGHSFVLGKLICIRGAWGYDGVWQITSLGTNSFTVTSNINLGMVHPSSASASDLACSLLLDNATLPVNEHSWSNILFEGIEAPNTGSVAVMLDATRSDYTLAQHSFNNVFLDSGKDIGFYAVGKYVSTIPNIQGLTLNGVRGHGTLNGIRLHDASAVLMNAVRVDRVGSDPNAAALVLEQWAPGTMRRVKVAGSLIGAGSVSGLDFPTAIKGRGSLAEIFIPAADVVGSVSGVELSQQLPPYTVSA